MTIESSAQPISIRPNLAPFDPLQTVIMGLLFAPVGSAATIGLNWRRLGKPNRFYWTILIAVVAVLVLQFLYGVVIFLLPDVNLAETLLIGGVYDFLFALAMIEWQRKSYQSWKALHGEPTLTQRGGCRSIILILAVILLFDLIYAVELAPTVAADLTLPLISALRPSVTFDDPAFSLTYPGVWITRGVNQVSYDTCVQGKCLLILSSYIKGDATFAIIRVTDPALTSLSLASVERTFWEHVQARYQNTRSEAPLDFTLDGQPAIKRLIYRVDSANSQQTRDIAIFAQDKQGGIIRIEAITYSNASNQLVNEIQGIIDSIHFR